MIYAYVLLPYEITLFSNDSRGVPGAWDVLLPYEITLFSNPLKDLCKTAVVLLPYEITLFSNLRGIVNNPSWFYYLMKLHYSQTRMRTVAVNVKFYYLMKLHYSQTCSDKAICQYVVLLPYEITLFSNGVRLYSIIY